MKNKKILSLLMAILLAVSLLSGCGSKEGPDEKPIQLEKAGDEVDIEKLLAEIEEAENYSKMRDFMRERYRE